MAHVGHHGQRDHGTHVAGTIAAARNGVGIVDALDAVTPPGRLRR